MKKSLIAFIVLTMVGLVHGLIYVVLMPPWQHYDEPTHFEYVWLLANRLRIPIPGDYDPQMSREVLQSMIDNGFYNGMGYEPDLSAATGDVRIGGYPQLDEPPGYYLLAAIPVRLLRNHSVTYQVYAARLVSVGLLVVSILAIYGMIQELTRSGSPLRWIIPGGVALLPGYVELMSAVNNDVGAAASMAIVLWGAVRLVRRGWQWWTFAWSGAAMILCFTMKETAYLAAPVWMLAVALSIFRKGWIRLVWIGFAASVALVLVGAIGMGDANLWYRATYQAAGSRVVHPKATVGQGVFSLQLNEIGAVGGGRFPLNQLVPEDIVSGLRGKVVTVGAWIWADESMDAPMPALTAVKNNGGIDQAYHMIDIGTEPVFYSYVTSVPEDTRFLQIHLGSKEQVANVQSSLYYDGVVLALGEHPLNEAPVWDSPSAQTGSWGDASIVNAIRNASAEAVGLRVYPWIDRLVSKVIPDNGSPSLILYSLVDSQASGSYYQQTANNMLQSFWGRFGWGHVLLEGKAVYYILTGISILGFVGCCAVFWEKLPQYQLSVLALLGLTLLGVWGLAVIRGAIYMFNWPFVPGARYAFPVIGPTMGLIGYGWWSIMNIFRKGVHLKSSVIVAVLGLAMLVLDLWSILSIWRYYAA